MLRLDFNSSILDFKSFVRENKLSLLICFIFILIGAILGVVVALGFDYVTREYLMRFNVFVVVVGDRGFFGYFLVRFILLLVVVFAISLVGIRRFSAWLALVFVLAFSFQALLFVTLMFIYAGFTALPLMLFGVIPFIIIAFLILSFYLAFIFSQLKRCPVVRISDCKLYFKNIGTKLLLVSIIFLIFALIESAFVVLLAIGLS